MFKKAILGLFLLYIWAFSVQANVVHDQLKNVLTSELSKLTGHQVKIGNVEGNLLKRVVLQNVTLFNPNEPTLAELASIKELIIEFNLSKAIMSGGDFPASIKKIMMTAPQINLQRGVDKNWNFDFSNLKPQEGSGLPVFNFELVILEGQFQIKDAYHLTGFKLNKPFEQTLEKVSGKVFFRPNGEFETDLSVQWIQNKKINPLVFTGTAMLDFSKSNLELKTLKGIALAPLLNYVLPPQDINFSDLIADLSLKLVAGPQQKLETQLSVQLQQGTASFPKVFSLPIQNIQGQVTMKKNILNLQNLSGSIEQTPVRVSGPVNLNGAEPQLQVKVLFPKFNLNLLPQGMTALKNLKIAGQANAQIEITGPVSVLAITGQFEKAAGQLYEIDFEGTTGQFSFIQKVFSLSLTETLFAGGNGNFQMKMDLENSDPHVQVQGTLKNIEIESLSRIPQFFGRADLNLKGSGPWSQLPLNLELETQSAQYQNQTFTALKGEVRVVSQNRVVWENLGLWNQNQKLDLTNGFFTFDQTFSTNLQSVDWDLKNLPVGGRLLSGSFVFSGQVSGDLKQQPLLETMEMRLSGYFDDMTFDKQWVRRGQGELLLTQGLWSFNDLSLETGDSIFEGSIALTASEIKKLKVLPRTKIYLSDIAQLRAVLPGVEGEIAYEGELQGQFLNPDLNGKLKLSKVKYQDQALLDLFEIQIVKVSSNIQIEKAQLEIDHQILEWSTVFNLNEAITFLENKQVSKFPFYFSAQTQGLQMETWSDRLRTLQTLLRTPEDSFGPVPLQENQIAAIDFTSPAETRVLYDWQLANHELGQYLQYVAKNNTPTLNEFLLNQLGLEGFLKGHFVWNHTDLKNPFDLEAKIEIEKLKTTHLSAKSFLLTSSQKENSRYFEAKADDLIWSHQEIKNVDAGIHLTPDRIVFVDKVILTSPQGDRDEIITGNWPLGDNALVDLNFKIPGRYFSFLAYPGSVIASIESPGFMTLRLSGPKDHLSLTSEKIDLTGTRFTFSSGLGFKNPLKITNQDLVLDKNQLQIKNFEILEELPENSGQAEPNVYKFFGVIDFNQIDWQKPGRLPVAFDLQMRDSELALDLPEKYRGKIKISNFSFKGVWPFTLTRVDRGWLTDQINAGEKFVRFQSTLTVYDGTILVPKKSYPASDVLPIFYDWEVVLGQDVKLGVEGGVLGEDLSNLLTRYQFETKPTVLPLKMVGYSNQLQLDGRFDLSAGNMAVFNRRFELVLPERQRKFFKGDNARVKNNQIIFKSHGGRESLNDQISFSLVTETDLPEGLDVDGKTVSESAYLMIMEGPVNAISSLSFVKYQTKGLEPGEQISDVYYFVDPETGRPMESTKLYALIWDLSPGVLKNLQKGTVERQGVTTLVRDLTSEQANLFFRQIIRPIEKGIASGANLYDVKIRHDFSQEISEIFTDTDTPPEATTGNAGVGNTNSQTTTTTTPVDKKNVVSVGLVWELMKNRLYFTLNTYLDQRLDSQRYDFGISSYKLTYSLFKELILDEILLSYENEFISESQQLQTYSIETSHRF